MRKIYTACALAALATACGGESGGSGSTTPPLLPTLTFSNASFELVENSDFSERLDASASNGAGIAFSIAGGPDANRFALSGNELRLTFTPNFERPQDADRDNIYEVEVRASVDSVAVTRTVRLEITNDAEGIAVTRVATGLGDVVDMALTLSDTGHFLVATRDGTVHRFDADYVLQGSKVVRDTRGEVGEILSIATWYPRDSRQSDPEGSRAFVAFRVPSGDAQLAFIRQRTIVGDDDDFDLSVRGVQIAFNLGSGDVHVDLKSDPSAELLYVATGDGGNPAAAQADDDSRGKLFLIRHMSPYAVASCCRYYRSELVASGFRQPQLGGNFAAEHLSDRGLEAFDELYDLDISASNYGWPDFEADFRVGDASATQDIVPNLGLPRGTSSDEVTGITVGALSPVDFGFAGGAYVFSDDRGRLLVTGADDVTTQAGSGATPSGFDAVEDHSLDFSPDAGSIDRPIALLPTTNAVGVAVVLILDEDGELFVAQ